MRDSIVVPAAPPVAALSVALSGLRLEAPLSERSDESEVTKRSIEDAAPRSHSNTPLPSPLESNGMYGAPVNKATGKQPASEKTDVHVPSVSAESDPKSREPQVRVSRPSVADLRPLRVSVARRPSLALRLGLSSRRFSIVTHTSGAIGFSVASSLEMPADDAQEASATALATLKEAVEPTGEEAAMNGFSAEVASSDLQKLRETTRPRFSETSGYASRPPGGRRMSQRPSLIGRLLDRPKLPARRSLFIAPVSASAIPPPIRVPIRVPVATEENELKAKLEPLPSDGQTTQAEPPRKAGVAAAETSTAVGRKKDRKVLFYVPRNAPIYFNFDPLAPDMADLNVFHFEATEQVDHFEYEYVEAEGGIAMESTGASTESRAPELTLVSLGAGKGGGEEGEGDGEEQPVRKVRVPLPTLLTPISLTADELYAGDAGRPLLERLGPHNVAPAPDVCYARKWARRRSSMVHRLIQRQRLSPNDSTSASRTPGSGQLEAIDETGAAETVEKAAAEQRESTEGSTGPRRTRGSRAPGASGVGALLVREETQTARRQSGRSTASTGIGANTPARDARSPSRRLTRVDEEAATRGP